MVIAFALIVILIFVWTPTGKLKGETSNDYITIVREDDTNTVQNSLDLAKKFLETSLNYAVYQAIEDTSIMEDEQTLSQLILNNLNIYTESGKKTIASMGKEINLLEFKKIILEPRGNYMQIKAEAEKELSYETKLNENDILYQEKNADLDIILPFSIFEMKNEAQSIFDSVKSNSCGGRKYDSECGRYYCKASSVMEDTCKTTIKVEYRETTYPVLENDKAVFKNLGLTFTFKE